MCVILFWNLWSWTSSRWWQMEVSLFICFFQWNETFLAIKVIDLCSIFFSGWYQGISQRYRWICKERWITAANSDFSGTLLNDDPKKYSVYLFRTCLFIMDIDFNVLIICQIFLQFPKLLHQGSFSQGVNYINAQVSRSLCFSLSLNVLYILCLHICTTLFPVLHKMRRFFKEFLTFKLTLVCMFNSSWDVQMHHLKNYE